MSVTRELESQIVPLGGDRYVVRVKPRDTELPLDIQLVVDPEGEAPLYVPRLPQMPGPIAVFVVTLTDLPSLPMRIEFADSRQIKLRGATTTLRADLRRSAPSKARAVDGQAPPVDAETEATSAPPDPPRATPAPQARKTAGPAPAPAPAPPPRAGRTSVPPPPPPLPARPPARRPQAAASPPDDDTPSTRQRARPKLWEPAQLVDTLSVLTPAVLIVVLSFSSGGSLPGATALCALVLGLLVALRLALDGQSLGGFRPRRVAGIAALGLLLAWVLLSSLWSHAPARAILDYDRDLLYLLAFVLLGLGGRRSGDVRLLVGALSAAAVAVCGCALITRLLPGVWAIPAGAGDAERLNYPLAYWNALGLLAAIGFVLSLALTCDHRASRLGRVLAAAALPILGTTLLFTFSRGSIAVCAAGILAMIAVGRPRALLSGVAIAVPTVGVAVAVAYGADLLASPNPTSDAAAAQGRGVALVLVICIAFAVLGRYLLLRYDEPAVLRRLADRLPRGPVPIGAAVAVAIVAALAIGAQGTIQNQYDTFITDSGRSGEDLRGRLDSTGNNGRTELWAVALDAFRDEPLHGYGSSTFGLQLDHRGSGAIKVEDAHSVYLETLAELGIVGFLLVCGAILLVLAGFLLAARGPDRVLGGALFGAGVAWALQSGVDYMWEYPAVTAWLFAAGGLVLAGRTSGEQPSAPRTGLRDLGRSRLLLSLAGALVCLGLLLLPLRVYRSDGPLRDAQRAFHQRDCATAIARSQSAISALPARPEPYVLIGYCRAQRHESTLAINAMKDAVKRDPDNWTAHFGLAIARASAGLDPRPRLVLALRLRPRVTRHVPGLQRYVTDALDRFAGDDPAVWRRRALEGRLPVASPNLQAPARVALATL